MSKHHPFVPAYAIAGFSSYQEYLESPEWNKTKRRIYSQYPKSRYCWICDTKKYINLHHENYWAIPNEQFMKDVVWMCEKHHLRVHILNNGERTPLEKPVLEQRRKELRSRYIRTHLRPSTLLHFTRIWFYRLLW